MSAIKTIYGMMFNELECQFCANCLRSAYLENQAAFES
jgi:hypothetical protein